MQVDKEAALAAAIDQIAIVYGKAPLRERFDRLVEKAREDGATMVALHDLELLQKLLLATDCPECQGRGEAWGFVGGIRTPEPVRCDYCCGTGSMAISNETTPPLDDDPF